MYKRQPLSDGLLFEFRGGLSKKDQDTRADGDELRARAYEFALGYDRQKLKIGIAKSRIGADFQGLGLDRFQTAGDRRFASQNGLLEIFRWSYKFNDSITLRGLFRQALTNLKDDPTRIREKVDTSNLEADLKSVFGGELDIRFAAEDALTRAANQLVETESCLLYTSPSPRD